VNPERENLPRKWFSLAAVGAGALISLAILGSLRWDPLRMALLPAALLVVVVAREFRRPAGRRWASDIGALAVQAGALGLLALAVLGGVVEARQGLAPSWMAALTFFAGFLFAGGTVLLGVGMATGRAWPRWAALLFAASFPVGLALDAVTRVSPQGEFLFFAGAGAHVSVGLFAVALIRLGLVRRTSLESGVAG
jgi:hypothetical protein